MKAGADNGRYRIVSEINMIPFIDVALVLLIIFMVMTPFLVRAQIKVNLPKAGQAEPVDQADNSLTVQVDKAGGVFVEGLRVATEDIVPTLRGLLPDPRAQPLRIEADKDVSFQHVVVVLDAGKRLGVTRMGVCVKPERGRGPEGGGK